MIGKEDELIIEYLTSARTLRDDTASLEFSYISNPDGTIRWIFPKNLNTPMFLNFYSTSSIRAKLLVYLIKSAYFFRLSKLVNSGGIKIQIQNGSILDKILKKYKYDGFSIFTGTIGENRKAIIEINKNNQTNVFVKIALAENSKILVQNEIEQIRLLSQFDFKKTIIPKLLGNIENNVIELSNIKPKKYNQNTDISDLHINVLNELYSQTHKVDRWSNLYQLERTKKTISSLLHSKNLHKKIGNVNIIELCQKINLLSNNLIEEDGLVVTSISHGDFTPWNMFVAKDKIHLLDWELSENETPLLFDLIHFTFQSTILIKQKGFKEISISLKEILKRDSVQLIIVKFNLDFNKLYAFYLIQTISYYLDKYSNQENLHAQVTWLVEAWDEAVSDLLEKKQFYSN